jgi:hypothetical protein
MEKIKNFITCSISGQNFDPYKLEGILGIPFEVKYKRGERYSNNIQKFYNDGFGTFSYDFEEKYNDFGQIYFLLKILRDKKNIIKEFGGSEIDCTIYLNYKSNSQNNFSISTEEIKILSELDLYINISIL